MSSLENQKEQTFTESSSTGHSELAISSFPSYHHAKILSKETERMISLATDDEAIHFAHGSNLDGKDIVEICEENISVEKYIELVSSPTAGAISSFLGTTRNEFDGKVVTMLHYEAYVPMALKEMKKLCTQLRSKWDLVNIAVVHRIGQVPIQQTSVFIVISSVHRRESLEAVHYAIDWLKANVPIWKKEYYADGSESVWKENKECFFGHHAD